MIVPTAVNGRINEAFLGTLPGFDGDGSPHTADLLAARSYARMRRDLRTATGLDLLPTPGFSCYRTLADQEYMRSTGATTIPVGKSIHGEALAVDYQGTAFGSTRHNWLKANARRYGWEQPPWAQAGGSLPEPWHWEYDARLDTQPAPIAPPPQTSTPAPTPPVPEEDIMASIDELAALLDARLAPILAAVNTDGAAYNRLDFGSVAWLDLGTCRRRLTLAQWQPRARPIGALALADPFWRLPIVGDAWGECYRQTGTSDAWLLEVLEGVLVRRLPTRQQYLDNGAPPIVDIPASHAFWQLPTRTS